MIAHALLLTWATVAVALLGVALLALASHGPGARYVLRSSDGTVRKGPSAVAFVFAVAVFWPLVLVLVLAGQASLKAGDDDE